MRQALAQELVKCPTAQEDGRPAGATDGVPMPTVSYMQSLSTIVKVCGQTAVKRAAALQVSLLRERARLWVRLTRPPCTAALRWWVEAAFCAQRLAPQGMARCPPPPTVVSRVGATVGGGASTRSAEPLLQ